MQRKPILALLALVCLAALLASCGSGIKGCTVAGITMSPLSATASHTATPPGNSQRFAAFEKVFGDDCVTTQSNSTRVVWSVSDPINVSISNVQDVTYGVATCTGATSGASTVMATLPVDKNGGTAVSGTAQLSCN